MPPTSGPIPTCTIPDTGVGSQFFPETGHSLSGVFKQYWQAHGGLAQFGYPLTEEMGEDAWQDAMLVFELTDRIRDTIQQMLYRNLMKPKSAFS